MKKNLGAEKNMGGYFSRRRVSMARLLPSSASHVLEVGCGEGQFKENLRTYNDYWGIEPDKLAAEAASRRLTKVFFGTYNDNHALLPNEFFDLVICNDVIEHMPDHQQFLNSIQEKMARDALLIGSVPNIRYFRALYHIVAERNFKYVDAGIFDRTHLRFFTCKSLEHALHTAGFKEIAVKGINPSSIDHWGPKGILRNVLILFFGIVTFGRTWDCQFLQIAFSAKKGS